jgi:hypothetical protein
VSFGDDDAAGVPRLECLVAGTLALMTCWADPPADLRVEPATHRRLLARKIVSNLFFICRHPHASESLRAVMGKARCRWQALACPACADAADPAAPAGGSHAIH